MTLRQLREERRATLGGWCTIPDAFSAELMGRCGFDWVCIDTQHGLIGYERMTGMLQALSLTGTPALVRVPWNQPDHIMKALDAGAQGVIVPMVSSAADARAAVAAMRYPPEGTRSWGPIRAALEVPGYSAATGNQRTFVVVMIETPGGVENLEEIVSVPGVDAVYVGPADLALGYGMAPDMRAADPAHHKLIETVLDGCLRHGVVPGIHCDRLETVYHWWDLGFEMCTLASDGALLRGAAGDAVRQAAARLGRAGETASAPSPPRTTASYA